jgi:hypothetical protein
MVWITIVLGATCCNVSFASTASPRHHHCWHPSHRVRHHHGPSAPGALACTSHILRGTLLAADTCSAAAWWLDTRKRLAVYIRHFQVRWQQNRNPHRLHSHTAASSVSHRHYNLQRSLILPR